MTDDITALRAQLEQARADLAASRDNERRLTEALDEERRDRIYAVGVAHGVAWRLRNTITSGAGTSMQLVARESANELLSLRK
jgi:hypothetical protein